MNRDKYQGHTPGPWQTWNDGVKAANGEIVAQVFTVDADHAKRYGMGESDANARLIADAPRLATRVERLEAALRGCADALMEAGKDFALWNPRAVRPNLYELHADAAQNALES